MLEAQLPQHLDKESSDMKIGVTRIVRAAPRRRQALALEIEAWPWWVERELNRRLLRAPEDSQEELLARRLGQELFTKHSDAGSYTLPFPSAFYVEVAVVDANGCVLLLAKKSSSGSNMAESGRRWTCSIEEGAELADVEDGRIDPKKVVMRGLKEELGLDASDVARVRFGMVALQSRHLNTSLLGVVEVRQSCELLAQRAAQGAYHDFLTGESVSLREAYDRFDGSSVSQPEGSWHATARFRLKLALDAFERS
jgi:hypothetical protein